MAIAAARVEEMQVDVCDINMGCPANKILKGCAGAGLMRDLGQGARDHRGVPEGAPDDAAHGEVPARDHATRRRTTSSSRRICEGEGVAAVALHARTAKQMYTGRADWSRRSRASRRPSRSPSSATATWTRAEDVLAMFRQTGCDAVMCGRATMKNPWIFRQAAELLAGRPVPRGDARGAARRHPRALPPHPATTGGRAEGDDVEAPDVHGWYTHGLPNGGSCAAASRPSRARRRSSTPSRSSSRRTPRESRPEGSRAAA